jgi:hypothetical protein
LKLLLLTRMAIRWNSRLIRSGAEGTEGTSLRSLERDDEDGIT